MIHLARLELLMAKSLFLIWISSGSSGRIQHVNYMNNIVRFKGATNCESNEQKVYIIKGESSMEDKTFVQKSGDFSKKNCLDCFKNCFLFNFRYKDICSLPGRKIFN